MRGLIGMLIIVGVLAFCVFAFNHVDGSQANTLRETLTKEREMRTSLAEDYQELSSNYLAARAAFVEALPEVDVNEIFPPLPDEEDSQNESESEGE